MRTASGSESLVHLVGADFRAFLALDDVKGRSLRRCLDVLTHPGFLAVVIFRLSAAAHERGLVPVARLLFLLNFVLFSTEVSPRLKAGPGFVLAHPQGVALGAGVKIGRGVRVLRGVAVGTAGYKDTSRDGFPVIGDGAVLYDSAKVFGPVTVGDGAVIGTGVTLFESVPDRAVVVAKQQLEVRLPGAAGRSDLAVTAG